MRQPRRSAIRCGAPIQAVILWTGAHKTPGGELLKLERFLRELADSLELRDGPLFVAADRVSGWGWLPLSSATELTGRIRSIAADHADPPYLAIGTPQQGIAGFRRSHRQARDAHRVAVAGPQDRRITAAGDPGVATAALLTEDLAQTRQWVCDTLGLLASDSINDGRLRETLRVFLGEGSSYTTAAEKLNLHHNSVRYRVSTCLRAPVPAPRG
jgi:DNA-binding PucR family transcriptional regulator